MRETNKQTQHLLSNCNIPDVDGLSRPCLSMCAVIHGYEEVNMFLP